MKSFKGLSCYSKIHFYRQFNDSQFLLFETLSICRADHLCLIKIIIGQKMSEKSGMKKVMRYNSQYNCESQFFLYNYLMLYILYNNIDIDIYYRLLCYYTLDLETLTFTFAPLTTLLNKKPPEIFKWKVNNCSVECSTIGCVNVKILI